MRQGITTRYLGPTNSKGSRIKAIARKASSLGKEMSLTVPYEYLGMDRDHTKAAQALATKLGWHGLWVAAGKPEEDGNMYVNIGRTGTINQGEFREGSDWFFVAEEVKA